jgi:hypothetical protein
MSSLSDAELAELGARAARLEYRYAFGVDTFDIEALRALATDDVKLTRIGATQDGMENFLNLYRGTIGKGVEVSKHVITNVLADRNADGEIEILAEFTATHVFADKINLTLGRYNDTAREVDGVLMLCHKSITVDRVISLPPSSSTATGVAPAKS